MTVVAALAVAALAVAAVLGVGEVLHRSVGLDGEWSRTTVHVLSSLVVAALPFFLGRWQVVGLALVFAVVLAVSRRLDLLIGIHHVERRTWGEVALPMGAALTQVVGVSPPAFAYGFLVLGLGDSAAGVVGRRLGRHRFRVGGGQKSVEGSAALAAVAVVLGVVALAGSTVPAGRVALAVVGAAAACTAAEASLGLGLDNLVLPLVGAVSLSVLSGAWPVGP